MSRFLFLLATLLLSILPAHAGITVSVFQGKPVSTVRAGMTVESVVPIETMVPGETVIYRYDVRNETDLPARDVTVRTAIPDNTTYIRDSAMAMGWTVLVSHDGVAHAQEGTLVITEIDETTRPALASDIRHLRWTLPGSFEPQGRHVIEFRVTLDR